jgi:hypothetical protein
LCKYANNLPPSLCMGSLVSVTVLPGPSQTDTLAYQLPSQTVDKAYIAYYSRRKDTSSVFDLAIRYIYILKSYYIFCYNLIY